MNSIFDEYRRFAGPKLRISDQEVINNINKYIIHKIIFNIYESIYSYIY